MDNDFILSPDPEQVNIINLYMYRILIFFLFF